MNKALLDTLLATGKLTQAEAEAIAKGFPAGGDGATVDTDKLTKALEGLRDTLKKGGAAAIYTQEDMDKLAQESGSVVEAVTAAADKLAKGFGEHIDKLGGLVVALTEKVQELETRVDAQSAGLSKSLGIPMDRKSKVDPDPDPAKNGVQPSPNDGGGAALTKSMVANAALGELANVGTDQMRKGQLTQAISLLNAGAAAQQVKDQFNIKVPA